MRKSFLLIAFPILLTFPLVQDAFDQLTSAIRTGNSHQVSEYFGATVDLNLLDKEDVYGKGQAELMLRDFFSKNPPKSFQLVHQGRSPEGTRYGIGTLISTNGKSYRISFYLKNMDGKQIIKEFWVEQD
jgi:hypothetical protein